MWFSGGWPKLTWILAEADSFQCGDRLTWFVFKHRNWLGFGGGGRN